MEESRVPRADYVSSTRPYFSVIRNDECLGDLAEFRNHLGENRNEGDKVSKSTDLKPWAVEHLLRIHRVNDLELESIGARTTCFPTLLNRTRSQKTERSNLNISEWTIVTNTGLGATSQNVIETSFRATWCKRTIQQEEKTFAHLDMLTIILSNFQAKPLFWQKDDRASIAVSD